MRGVHPLAVPLGHHLVLPEAQHRMSLQSSVQRWRERDRETDREGEREGGGGGQCVAEGRGTPRTPHGRVSQPGRSKTCSDGPKYWAAKRRPACSNEWWVWVVH